MTKRFVKMRIRDKRSQEKTKLQKVMKGMTTIYKKIQYSMNPHCQPSRTMTS